MKADSARHPHGRLSREWVSFGSLMASRLSTARRSAKQSHTGDHLTHPRGHAEMWEQYQRGGLVSQEMEYEEPPRGRVIYHTKTRRFTFLADRCILRDKNVVRRIMSELKLPRNTETDTDSHYRCFRCLRARSN